MRIWTIQSIDVWNKLKEEKIVTCDEKLAFYLKDENYSFLEQYNWIRDKMINRIGHSSYKSNIYPIWGWYLYKGQHKKPDLRHSAHGPLGEQMTCIELEIPNEKVLLSDFELWHYVLNNGYIGNSTNEEELDSECEWLDSLPKEKRRNLIEESWDKIFNIKELLNNGIYSSGEYIQGTFWELRFDEVKKVQIFKAR
ncbi:DUF3841 domain-containing protein [Tissierella pigra]|uniref:DUF3841 domain-containing protein n=1 Tax=Tissierella pigra TaxID=2607614 RepID=A0A6N7XF90_9FIRM|nr:DUF3841 domain-containing protein [Tissierella pigra]MBU5425990.1 DUF3841 domain-containing protein [Tissierella pigra]MSU00649.1 DUF3841 domain-containing protein [Tissierella pigra]